MRGPFRAGLFVYAKDLARLATFYEDTLGLVRVDGSDELAVLQSADFELVVHRIPDAIAAGITIASPPEPREDTALKFYFTVPSLASAEATASALGGEVYAASWDGPGFRVRNARDPEGNIFQLREKR